MAKVITSGNIGILEHEFCENPEYTFDEKNGEVFVFGFKMMMMGKEVGVAKNYKTGLVGYTMIGGAEQTKKKCQNFDVITKDFGVDFERSLFFLKNE